MKQARQMIEDLLPINEQEVGRVVGSADDLAQAEDILSRNGIETDGTTVYEGHKAWTYNGKMVGWWDEEMGLVWRSDDAFAPPPGGTA